ncbi:MAG: PAS domain-containing hybrid sensor histidine kinase/response regulator [Nevskia sp.]
MIQLAKSQNITSIADFIGARYGRHQTLAMLVTLVAVIGIVPYIALQLKAVAFGFDVLVRPSLDAASPAAPAGFFSDGALVIALLLGMFAILFGTRQVVSSENHHGMVLAIAFESTVKLVAFLAVGLYVCYGLYDGIGDAYAHAAALPPMSAPLMQEALSTSFIAQTLLAAIAAVCLPRQFHVAVVENTSRSDLRRARWVFPLFLGLISVFVLPIAAAGLERLPAGTPADTFMLTLPIAGGHPWLAFAAYIGGFSAATSMVIVATIALSTMISNEVLMPVLLGSKRMRLAERGDLSALLKNIRRVAILGIVAAAYLYYRLFTGPGSLAAIGLLSFAAVAQFAPSVVGGLVWRGGSYHGALAGLAGGFAAWVYTLLLPALLIASHAGGALLEHGPFGIAALRPQALFGLGAFDPITHGALWSLGINLFCYVAVPMLAKPGLSERLLAGRFMEDPQEPGPAKPLAAKVTATIGDLQVLLERFFGSERALAELDRYAHRQGRGRLKADERASPELARYTEHLLSGAVGASSARLVLASALRGRDMQLEDVIQLLDETSHEIQFNRELLRATLEHLSQGVSVIDKDLRLVAWNRRYIELLDYPDGLVSVGRPIEEVFRFNARRGLFGPGEIEEQVARRLAHLRAGTPHMHERELPGGLVIEVRGNPMPGGGFVTSYSDVTAYKQAQRQLQDANDTLEVRVAERTQALDEAKLAAERANLAKTRFLAAASHDLVQPLNAARLFVASIRREELAETPARVIGQVEQSLTAAESLLGALLDISRLDAAAQELRREHFPLARVLDPLTAEFAALAESRGLALRVVTSRALVHTDPALLRRILQNFLSNAVRYTHRGAVLIGCRRLRGGGLRIEVWDTGPGIAAQQQREIFEEFRRLDLRDSAGERGLGLGLAIADRLARLLGHPLALRSWPGRGSVFSLTVPLGDAGAVIAPKSGVARRSADRIVGSLVLCLDNEPAVLEGLCALLTNWGCRVLTARNRAEAEQHWRLHGELPDLVLIDFHLDPDPRGDADGIQAMSRLQALWRAAVPGIVLTADHTQAARAAAAQQGYALLPKPVKPAALRALMSRQLGARGVTAASA